MRSLHSNPCSSTVKLAVAAGLILLMAVPSVHAITLKIATLSPDGSSWMKMMRQGAADVASQTEGRVKIKFYPGGVMGDEKSVMRKIRVGQLQGGAITAGSLSEFSSDNYVYNLPIIFNSLEEVDHVRREMDPLIVKGMYDAGFVTFGLAEGGFAYLMSKSPIASISELRQYKVWIPAGDGVSLETARAFGITPIPLTLPEVRTALQTGLIDTVATSPIAAIALQWHTQVNYITDTPLIYTYAVMAIDRRAFDKISAEDQKRVYDVMRPLWREIDRRNRKDNTEALEALRSQGIKFVKPKPPEKQEWQRIAAAVPEKMIASGKLSPEIVKKLEQYLNDYRSRSAAKNEEI